MLRSSEIRVSLANCPGANYCLTPRLPIGRLNLYLAHDSLNFCPLICPRKRERTNRLSRSNERSLTNCHRVGKKRRRRREGFSSRKHSTARKRVRVTGHARFRYIARWKWRRDVGCEGGERDTRDSYI